MTAEERLKRLIGDLQFQIAFLASALEQAQARVAELSKPKEE